MTGDWQRLDPRTLVTQPVRAIGQTLVTAVAALIGVGAAVGFSVAVPVMVGLVMLVGAVPLLTTSYRVTATHLEVRRGLLNRATTTVAVARVRSVDLKADLTHRILRVVNVAVGTGVDESRIELDSLSTAAAERLRSALLHGGGRGGEGEELPQADEVVRLSWSWVRFAPLNVRNLFLLAATVGALLNQLNGHISPREVRRVRHWLGGERIAPLVTDVLVAIVVLWIAFACAGYLARWFGLTLTREQGKTGPVLRLVHGAFTRRSMTIDEAKVRGIAVRRRALVGLAGGAELLVLSTGLGHDNEAQLLPVAPARVVTEVAARILREADAVDVRVRPHGRAAHRRCYVRHGRSAALVTLLAAGAFGAAEASGARVPPSFLAGVVLAVWVVAGVAAEVRYRRLGHALTDRYLVSATGTVTATRTALETDGIVGWRIRQSFWDRRLGLAQLTATTAAGSERVDIVDVPLAEAVATAVAATPAMFQEFLAAPQAAGGPDAGRDRAS